MKKDEFLKICKETHHDGRIVLDFFVFAGFLLLIVLTTINSL